jgi:hypothetical protein
MSLDALTEATKLLRKNPGCFTVWQLRQLERIDFRLGKLHREAHGILQRAKDLHLTIRQWREIGELLGTVATRLTFALRCREEILSAGRRQKYKKIIVRLGTYEYPNDEPPKPHEDDNEIKDEEDEKNFESQNRVQALLELASLIEDFISEHPTLRGVVLGVIFRQINRLKVALLKHLKDLEGRVLIPMTEIEVITDWDHEPIDEDDNDQEILTEKKGECYDK